MTISGGNPLIFLSSTVCVVLAAMTIVSLGAPIVQEARKRRRAQQAAAAASL